LLTGIYETASKTTNDYCVAGRATSFDYFASRLIETNNRL